MPDPTLQTVSASQVPALFGVSSWETRFALHQKFRGVAADEPETELMSMGKRLEPVILGLMGERVGLELTGNRDYRRAPDAPVGATVDGWARTPEGDLVWAEAKNVSWFAWRDMWSSTAAPLYVELQVQTQLMVPDERGQLPRRAYIGALVAGNDFHVFEREPNRAVQDKIALEARRFLDAVAADQAPPVAGDPIELPALLALYPEAVPEKVITIEAAERERVQIVADYHHAADQASFWSKAKDSAKLKLLELAGDAGRIVTPFHTAKIVKSPIKEATITRRAHTRTAITTAKIEGADTGAEPAADDAANPLGSG